MVKNQNQVAHLSLLALLLATHDLDMEMSIRTNGFMFPIESLVLPFQVNHTWYKVYGLLRLEEKILFIELETVENILGLFHSKVRTIALQFDEIATVRIEKKWHGNRALLLRTFSLKMFKHFPGSKQGEVILRIGSKDKAALDEFVVQLGLKISERKLHRLQNEDEPDTASAEAFPPDGNIRQLQDTWRKLKAAFFQ